MDISRKLSTMLLCAGLCAAATVANAGVNLCVDADGKALLTDTACPSGSRVANDDVSDSGATGVVINSGAAAHVAATDGREHVAAAAGPSALPRSRWADLPRPLERKAARTDATTLQVARANLQLGDEMRRQSRLASR